MGEDIIKGKNVKIHPTALIYPNVVLHDNVFIGPYCIIGEPTSSYYQDPEHHEFKKTEIGANSIIRSHSIIYEDVNIGENFQTGHHVTIREDSHIGKNCSVGTLSDIQGTACIGDFVRIHSNVFIAPLTTIKNYVWIFPHVVVTNDTYPPLNKLEGVTIEECAIVAAGAVILPGVTVGKHALVVADALVSKDVAPHCVVMGHPAKYRCQVEEILDNDENRVYPWPDYLKDFRGYPWQVESKEKQKKL